MNIWPCWNLFVLCGSQLNMLYDWLEHQKSGISSKVWKFQNEIVVSSILLKNSQKNSLISANLKGSESKKSKGP